MLDRNDAGRYIEVRGRASVSEDIDRTSAAQLADKYENPGAGAKWL
ncbi:hypothetical protein ACFOW4_16840 [Micromonospora sp. GCM10011542]